MRPGALVEIAIYAAIFAGFALAVLADAPAGSDGQYSDWFRSLKQPITGMSCCGTSDGRVTDLRQTANGYEAWIDERFGVTPGQWMPVPADKILDRTDNPLGRPVVFYNATHGIICVVRPAEI